MLGAGRRRPWLRNGEPHPGLCVRGDSSSRAKTSTPTCASRYRAGSVWCSATEPPAPSRCGCALLAIERAASGAWLHSPQHLQVVTRIGQMLDFYVENRYAHSAVQNDVKMCFVKSQAINLQFDFFLENRYAHSASQNDVRICFSNLQKAGMGVPFSWFSWSSFHGP